MHMYPNNMNRNKQTEIAVLLLGALLLLSCLLCGCGDNLLLPTGGYDYRMSSSDGAILGYPIPRKGSNPCCYTLPLSQSSLPTAFSYDADRMEYSPMQVQTVTLALPDSPLAVPCVNTDEGHTFFAAASDTVTVYQGDIGDMAVVLTGGVLYLADAQTVLPIAEDVQKVWSIHTELRCLLYSDAAGVLYEYRDNDGENESVCISTGAPVTEAWYVYGTDAHTVVFKGMSDRQAAWYYTEDGCAAVPAVIPSAESSSGSDTSVVFIRDTACVLAGGNDSAYFYDIRSGRLLDMDMGGLYRFPRDTDVDTLAVSPDGRFVYLYDIDFIYRLNLETGDLDLAYNEAPIFEGSCILSSMTPVTDEIVLLSQAANEYTEYVPTITCAVFEEDIPEVRHEDEKIDLDYHTWQTDDE